ncbi:WhiB family transcriptional regulator [Streptomyces sp. NPDC001404]|uniref:WhiB family transcriptional regulator n=1 Tax=Streptomyces sp. NPDC001404 TaxID=3364571 RepID=UPI0036AB2F42
MFHSDQKAERHKLESHPQWRARACARVDALGQPLVDADLFFAPGPEAESAAKTICSSCPLLDACRAYAVGGTGWWEADGVWGGLSAAERRAMRRAERKRRNRVSQQGDRPTPVADWQPSTAQDALLRALVATPDLRVAAKAVGTPYPNARWVYSQLCGQLGLFPDEVTISELLAVAGRATTAAAGPGSLEAAA